MRVAIVGTGGVARQLGGDLAGRGHDVVLGSRDPAATAAKEEWQGIDLRLAPLADLAVGADLVINATNGQGSLDALASVGPSLDDKVLLDLTNPLDFSQGFPPTLTVKDTDSLAEQIQRAHPTTRVVKSLNTLANSVMLHPERVGGGDTSVFVAGDDAEARTMVANLLRDFGWTDVIEFDSLTAARGLEMWLPLWVRLMGTLGTAEFNLKIVR
jgi:hypothetical protein